MKDIRFIRTIEVWQAFDEQGLSNDFEVLVAVPFGTIVRTGEEVEIPQVGRATVVGAWGRRDVPEPERDITADAIDADVVMRLRVRRA